MAQRGQNGLKMASNAAKWPFPGQIWLSPRGSTPHSKLGAAGTGTPQQYSGSVLDFCPNVYIGYPLPYVHRVPPSHMYMAYAPPRHRFGVFCLFSVLWYTFLPWHRRSES